jgi:type IV pilus assembly protein PilF
LCRQKRFDDAEKQFERSIGAATNDYPELMMTNAGVCVAQKPDYRKAESYFRRALERRPNYGEALLQMTLLKVRAEDYLGARAFMQRYRSTNPPNPGILYLCVLIEAEMGDERERLECSNELLRDFPDSEESKRMLGN